MRVERELLVNGQLHKARELGKGVLQPIAMDKGTKSRAAQQATA